MISLPWALLMPGCFKFILDFDHQFRLSFTTFSFTSAALLQLFVDSIHFAIKSWLLESFLKPYVQICELDYFLCFNGAFALHLKLLDSLGYSLHSERFFFSWILGLQETPELPETTAESPLSLSRYRSVNGDGPSHVRVLVTCYFAMRMSTDRGGGDERLAQAREWAASGDRPTIRRPRSAHRGAMSRLVHVCR